MFGNQDVFGNLDEVRLNNGGSAGPADRLGFIFVSSGQPLVIEQGGDVINHGINCYQNATNPILPAWRKGKQRLREVQGLAWRLQPTVNRQQDQRPTLLCPVLESRL